MQKLIAYVHCPRKCTFVPMRFCDDCRYVKEIIVFPNRDFLVEVQCKHEKDCFKGDEDGSK